MHSHKLKHTHTCTSSDSSCTCFDKSSFICRSRVVCNISLFSDEIQTRSLLLHRDVDREAVPNNTLTPADLSKAPLCFLIVFVVGLLTMHASFWNCDCCSGGYCWKLLWQHNRKHQESMHHTNLIKENSQASRRRIMVRFSKWTVSLHRFSFSWCSVCSVASLALSSSTSFRCMVGSPSMARDRVSKSCLSFFSLSICITQKSHHNDSLFANRYKTEEKGECQTWESVAHLDVNSSTWETRHRSFFDRAKRKVDQKVLQQQNLSKNNKRSEQETEAGKMDIINCSKLHIHLSSFFSQWTRANKEEIHTSSSWWTWKAFISINLWFSHSAFSRTSLAKFSSLSCYHTERDRETETERWYLSPYNGLSRWGFACLPRSFSFVYVSWLIHKSFFLLLPADSFFIFKQERERERERED